MGSQFSKYKPSEVKAFVVDDEGNLTIDFGNNKRLQFASSSSPDASIRLNNTWIDLDKYISEGFWRYDENTDNTEPEEGYLKFNDVDLINATELYISGTSIQGLNFITLLGFLTIGTSIQVKQFSDFTKGSIFSIKSITNNGTWFTFGIYPISANNFDSDDTRVLTKFISFPALSNRIIINQFNFSFILSESLDSTKEYFIDGEVNIGNMEIIVPVTGLQIKGLSFDTSKLIIDSDNLTMFKSNGGTSGNVILTDLAIEVSGTNSKVFDLIGDTGLEALEITRVNFNDCTSLGQIDNYRQGLELGTGRFGGTPELELIGNWIGGYRISTSIARNISSSVLFKAGTGFVLNGRFFSDINMEGETNASFIDFVESNITNDGALELSNCNFRNVSDPIPNIESSNIKCRFRNCTNLRDTYVGAQWVITSQATTTISLANTPVKLAGTTSYQDEQWFSHITDNAFVYDSEEEIEIIINGILSLNGGTNDQLNAIVRQWDNSESQYVDISESGAITANGGGGNRAEGISVLGFAILNKNDRIEIWVENQTDTTDITADLGGLVTISERQS